MGFLNLFRRNTFEHGIHPPEHKEITAGLPIRQLPFPPRLVVPLSQHGGAPAVPLVKPGQEVVRGEPIARANGFVSVPMHAPATGVVEAIQLMPSARGPKSEAIVIRVYEASPQSVEYEAPRDLAAMTPADIVKVVQDTGMVGLGGAAFPTHVKMSPPKEHTVDTVVVNGCECEPYLTCDHRVMLEHPGRILAGTRIAMRVVGAKQAVIGVEDNKLDAVAALQAQLTEGDPIRVQAVPTKYPQGAEKMLVESLLHRRIPPGSFPSSVGVSVFNVGTLAQIGELLPRGRGLIERVVTVTGPGVKHPGNFLVPVGTPIRFLLEHTGATPHVNELILGGPMMGMSVAAMDVPVTKAVSGMVVLEEQPQTHKAIPVQPCIRCAYCVEACPMHLNPSTMGLLAVKREYGRMAEEFHLNDCFECGCCSYVCPSNIPLVQYFRIAKAVNRERAGKNV
jgi:electron transport complex protein RnfC